MPYDVLAGVFTPLGFGAPEDEMFRDLVIARIVEPASILDTRGVLIDLGCKSASEKTMRGALASCGVTASFARGVAGGQAIDSRVSDDRALSRERLANTVEEAAAALGIGRDRTYDEIRTGRLRSKKVGARRVKGRYPWHPRVLGSILGPHSYDRPSPFTPGGPAGVGRAALGLLPTLVIWPTATRNKVARVLPSAPSVSHPSAQTVEAASVMAVRRAKPAVARSTGLKVALAGARLGGGWAATSEPGRSVVILASSA